MNRQLPRQVSSICIKERDIDRKTIQSIAIFNRLMTESRTTVDTTKSIEKERRYRRESIVFQIAYKHQLHCRPDLGHTGRISAYYPRPRLTTRGHHRRAAVYILGSSTHYIGSSWDHFEGNTAVREDIQTPHLTSASLGIRSLPREIELQEIEDRIENRNEPIIYQ